MKKTIICLKCYEYTDALGLNAPKITDVQYISNYNYSFYNGPDYTIISFDDGSMVKLLGSGGGAENMFNLQKNSGCTSNVYPFCAGNTSTYASSFVGTQQFGKGIIKTKFIPDFGGSLVIFLKNGKVLEVQGVGGGGTNMFAVTEPSNSTFAFENVSGYNYYIGDMWFNNSVSCYTRFSAPTDGQVTIGLSDGKITKISNAGGGHQCYYVHETGGNSGDPFDLRFGNYDPSHIIGEEWCSQGGSVCTGALLEMIYLPNLGQTLAFFNSGEYALIDGEGGGGGQSMYTGHWHFKGALGSVNGPAGLTCDYLEGNTLYAGFSNGQFIAMDISNTNLTITGSSDFGSPVTDFKKINGVYFLCLANGKVLQINAVGGGANCFGIAYQGGYFDPICGYNYYIGDEDFGTINATRMANPNAAQPIINNPTKATLTGINEVSPSNSLSNVSVSPNPNNGNFVVSAQNNSFGQLYISVLDGQGRIIKQESLYNIGDEINFSTLEGGVYYLNIRSSISTILPSVKKLFINK